MDEKKVIGLMDPNHYGFLVSIEKLIARAVQSVKYKGKTYEIATKRMKCKPYDVLDAWTETNVILNRGAHWNRHRCSFFQLVNWKTHLIYNMFSFKAIDKNVGYGVMHELGLKVPATWAIPQKDYSKMFEGSEGKIHPELLFEDHELFDLEHVGECVGYPAYLKPQDGGGWIGVTKVCNYAELQDAYDKSEDKPMNLQRSVDDYKEFCRSVGVGPQVLPMHYNASAEYSHDRYMRSADKAVEFNFLSNKETEEVNKITKIINAFYGWDHNSCESLINQSGEVFIIDYINAYPDSSMISLHFYFQELVKSMVKWLVFCAVVGRSEGYNFMSTWPKFFAKREESKKKGWDYEKLLSEYEKIADDYWQTKEFEEFCKEALPDFDEKAFEFFGSLEFDAIMRVDIEKYFKLETERPGKYAHYRGILDFWLHAEEDRLKNMKQVESKKKSETPEKSEKKVKSEKDEQPVKAVKAEKPEKTGKPEKTEKHEKPEKIEKPEKAEKSDKVEKSEKIENPEKTEKKEKTVKVEKKEKVEKKA